MAFHERKAQNKGNPMKQSPAQVLQLAEAVPENADNYRVLRELKAALRDLVLIAEAAK